jgi:pimeloyl-ACP methyl ester carboxylesterase
MTFRWLYLVVAMALPVMMAAETPLEARAEFKTHLLREQQFGEPAEAPPAGVLRLVRYPAPLGENAAYLSPNPGDGKKHPAVVWLTGGFSNSIGAIAWTPGPESNDQSASGFRDKGIVMLYPSVRGGNDNPGHIETFFGEIDDVLAAAECLANCDYVDSSRIYLGGHSTGGTLALLVAASARPGLFRAVFALGPVSDVRGYGQDVLPFDLKDAREWRLRMPLRFLPAINCPTYVIEGSKPPGNLDELRILSKASTNPLLHFRAIPGGSHFTIIRPTVAEIAANIAADATGTNSTFAYETKR